MIGNTMQVECVERLLADLPFPSTEQAAPHAERVYTQPQTEHPDNILDVFLGHVVMKRLLFKKVSHEFRSFNSSEGFVFIHAPCSTFFAFVHSLVQGVIVVATGWQL